MKIHIEYQEAKLIEYEQFVSENKNLFESKDSLKIELNSLKELIKQKEDYFVAKEKEYVNKIKELNFKLINVEDIFKSRNGNDSMSRRESECTERVRFIFKKYF
jgi:hypothetical protein